METTDYSGMFVYKVEQGAKNAGKALHQMSLEEMDAFWNEAKRAGN